jgi:hypothetical protein
MIMIIIIMNWMEFELGKYYKFEEMMMMMMMDSQRYATRGLLASTSLATRRMGAISTSEEGTTSLSKMDSPRLPAVWVRRILLPRAGEWEAEESAGGILRPPEEDAMLPPTAS